MASTSAMGCEAAEGDAMGLRTLVLPAVRDSPQHRGNLGPLLLPSPSLSAAGPGSAASGRPCSRARSTPAGMPWQLQARRNGELVRMRWALCMFRLILRCQEEVVLKAQGAQAKVVARTEVLRKQICAAGAELSQIGKRRRATAASVQDAEPASEVLPSTARAARRTARSKEEGIEALRQSIQEAEAWRQKRSGELRQQIAKATFQGKVLAAELGGAICGRELVMERFGHEEELLKEQLRVAAERRSSLAAACNAARGRLHAARGAGKDHLALDLSCSDFHSEAPTAAGLDARCSTPPRSSALSTASTLWSTPASSSAASCQTPRPLQGRSSGGAPAAERSAAACLTPSQLRALRCTSPVSASGETSTAASSVVCPTPREEPQPSPRIELSEMLCRQRQLCAVATFAGRARNGRRKSAAGLVGVRARPRPSMAPYLSRLPRPRSMGCYPGVECEQPSDGLVAIREDL